MPKIRSIVVSERTHSSLFLLQAKLMVLDKKQYSMDKIIDKLMVVYDEHYTEYHPLDTSLSDFKLENIETW